MTTKTENAIAALRDTIERFISVAQEAERTKNHAALKKMLENSVAVQPAMEEVVKAVTGKAYG